MRETIPRPEHPRPQFERRDWQTLNGVWTCRIHRNALGHTRDVMLPSISSRPPQASGPFEHEIVVPFFPKAGCPESATRISSTR
jgi:hypothetical protein